MINRECHIRRFSVSPSSTHNFDTIAATFDDNPQRVKRAEEIARAISEAVALSPDMDVMDFGCGTGLLTLQIQPHVRSVIGVDSSRGMLDVLERKIGGLGLDNVRAEYVDIEKGERLTGSYDLVTSSLTLHHIREIGPLFEQFYGIIKPGGHLCVADLDSEEGQFHEDAAGVYHDGFAREWMREVFETAGFRDVRDVTAAEMEKPGKDGAIRRFGIFLMTGRK
jgi:ubiquinone/menaquinone biosynthesis C-methylase UbiE